MEYSYLFDLDATITKKEILPALADSIGIGDVMKKMTEKTMMGEIPFAESFSKRVEMLSVIPVSKAREIIAGIPLHEELVSFIKEHADRCYVVTGNLDVWIGGLMEKIGISKDHCLCSKGRLDETGDKLLGIDDIIDKGRAIASIPHPFAAVGDGDNDAEMIASADIGIGFGAVRNVAMSLLNNATHAVYTEAKLCQLLRAIASKVSYPTDTDIKKTIVISCAGMGTRLGVGCTKALVSVAGKPLLLRQLELLKDYDDIRIVVGYQYEKVIEMVLGYRKDVTFVFNHNYKNTGTGDSFLKGAAHGRDMVVALDGDLLVHPDDLNTVLECPDECIGGTTPGTDNPVLMSVMIKEDGQEYVTEFSRQRGKYEWTGLMQMKKEHLGLTTGHVYFLLEPRLPMKMIFIRTREIDTMDDYKNAVRWIENGYKD